MKVIRTPVHRLPVVPSVHQRAPVDAGVFLRGVENAQPEVEPGRVVVTGVVVRLNGVAVSTQVRRGQLDC